MFAADNGNDKKCFKFMQTIKILILNGANINAKNSEGKTALDIAKGKGHEKAVELLKKYSTE